DLLLGRERLLRQTALGAAEDVLHDEEGDDEEDEQRDAARTEEDQLVLERAAAAEAARQPSHAIHERVHRRPPTKRATSLQPWRARKRPWSTTVGQTWLLSWWRLRVTSSGWPRPRSIGPAVSSVSTKRSAVALGPARRRPSTKARAARKPSSETKLTSAAGTDSRDSRTAGSSASTGGTTLVPPPPSASSPAPAPPPL